MSQRRKHTEEFKHEAVQLALSSNLPRQAIADDLGIGKSTLNAWLRDHRDDLGSCIDGGVWDSAYEKRIGELQLEKEIMQEKIAKCGRPIRDFDESFRTSMGFLANPHVTRQLGLVIWICGIMRDYSGYNGMKDSVTAIFNVRLIRF